MPLAEEVEVVGMVVTVVTERRAAAAAMSEFPLPVLSPRLARSLLARL